jgi:hypothetical protein
VRSAEFTQSELEDEIERLMAAGIDATQFVLALKKLALSPDPITRTSAVADGSRSPWSSSA